MGHGPFSKYSNQITYLDCAFEISLNVSRFVDNEKI